MSWFKNTWKEYYKDLNKRHKKLQARFKKLDSDNLRLQYQIMSLNDDISWLRKRRIELKKCKLDDKTLKSVSKVLDIIRTQAIIESHHEAYKTIRKISDNVQSVIKSREETDDE